MTARLHERLWQMRSRLAVQRWEYRQYRHAKGTWMRLRTVLTYTRKAYAIDEQSAVALAAEGYEAQSVGDELVPPKQLLFVPERRLLSVKHRREIPVKIGAELFAARHIALVPFE